jgi:hypothetical protein
MGETWRCKRGALVVPKKWVGSKLQLRCTPNHSMLCCREMQYLSCNTCLAPRSSWPPIDCQHMDVPERCLLCLLMYPGKAVFEPELPIAQGECGAMRLSRPLSIRRRLAHGSKSPRCNLWPRPASAQCSWRTWICSGKREWREWGIGPGPCKS